MSVSEEWIVLGDAAVAVMSVTTPSPFVAMAGIRTEKKSFRTADGDGGQNIVVLRQLYELIPTTGVSSTADTHGCRAA
jgi:hypothetical protein